MIQEDEQLTDNPATIAPPSPTKPSVGPKAAAQDERVSEVIGERVCIGCGFNLFGQPIVRERHYAMLIVRCPECGTVAALQEYPLLGKWANRWGRLLAAFWFLVVFFLILANSGIIAGFSSTIATNVMRPTAVVIAEKFRNWVEDHPDKFEEDGYYNYWQGANGTSLNNSQLAMAIIETEWWDDHGQAEMQTRSWNSSSRYDWVALSGLGWTLFWLSLLGILWAVAIPTRSIRKALFFLIIVYACALFWLLGPMIWIYYENNWWRSAQDIALNEFGEVALVVVAGLQLIPLALALIYGRILARWIVLAFLPPRMRGWVAFLWIVDGKTPPKKTWLDR